MTAWCVIVGNELYVAADDPDEKRWVEKSNACGTLS